MTSRASPYAKALILVTSRPESVEVAVETSRPEVLALIFSQDVLLAVAAKCSELSDSGVSFRHRMVDRPMEIEDAFDKFSLALSDLEEMGLFFFPKRCCWTLRAGTTPMRVGTALAAMTRGIGMVHQRVPQRYVDGNWSRDMSRGIEVVPNAKSPPRHGPACAKVRRWNSSTGGITGRRRWSSRTWPGR